MKCEIIRDLFPSYIDGLTSKESNDAIEKHLEICSECSEILKQMKEEIKLEDVENNKIDIKPLKKLNNKVRSSVIITASIFMVIIGVFLYVTCYGWKVKSDEVEVTYSYDENVIEIQIELKNDMNMLILSNGKEKTIRKVVPCFGIGEHNSFTLGIDYKDENGRFRDDMMFELEVEYADGKVVYDFAEIAKELGVRESIKH